MARKGGSIRDVAVETGFSIATVSRVMNGIGAVRLAEMYLDIERHPAEVLGDAISPTESAPDGARRSIDALASEVGFVLRQQLDITRRVAAEVSLWGADPARARHALGEVVSVGRTVGDSFDGGFAEGGGSPLWRSRSRHRHLEVFDLRLDAVKSAAKRLGVSVNDVFVGGSVLAAARYHEECGAEVSAFNLSFITSTRNDDAAGGNAFTPIPFSAGAAVRSATDHVSEVQIAMAEGVAVVRDSGLDLMEFASGLANLLPSSVVSKVGRARSAKQDWATSNLRGAPFPIYVAGGEITHMYPVGPVAGTAFNLTALSYNGTFHFGVHIDPRAVEDPAKLRVHLERAYADIITAET